MTERCPFKKVRDCNANVVTELVEQAGRADQIHPRKIRKKKGRELLGEKTLSGNGARYLRVITSKKTGISLARHGDQVLGLLHDLNATGAMPSGG